MDAVSVLLPGPTAAAICQVAGLLTGPDASDDKAKIAANMKHLAQILRNASAEAEQRRAEERQQQRQNETVKKATIRELLDRHQRDHDSGQEAA